MNRTLDFILCRNKGKGLQKVMTVEADLHNAEEAAIELCREIGAEVTIVANEPGTPDYYIFSVVSHPSFAIHVYRHPILYSRGNPFLTNEKEGGAK